MLLWRPASPVRVVRFLATAPELVSPPSSYGGAPRRSAFTLGLSRVSVLEPFAAFISPSESIPPPPALSTFPPASALQMSSPDYISPITYDSSFAWFPSHTAREENYRLISIGSSTSSRTCYVDCSCRGSFTFFSPPHPNLVDSWPRFLLVLLDLPADSSSTLVSVFGQLSVENINAGALEAVLETVRVRLAASRADSTS